MELKQILKSDPNCVATAPFPDQLVGDAIVKGDAEIVNVLLDFGAPINGYPSHRPLISAFPWPNLVRLLLERGADVAVTNSRGETLLTSARGLKTSKEVIKRLQQFGAKN